MNIYFFVPVIILQKNVLSIGYVFVYLHYLGARVAQ